MEYEKELRQQAELEPIRPIIKDEIREFYKLKGKEQGEKNG